MAVKISKVDVWAGPIVDEPGGLAAKLRAVAKAGAKLEFLVARRAPDKPGKGVVFIAPLKPGKQARAGAEVGLAKAKGMHSLRLSLPDKAGLGARITRALADANINLRGLSAAAIGKQCVVYFAFDTAAAANKAAKILKKTLAGR
ncbi:MAG TPA: ACT domain-containing protein [Phycisphaerae bacterium]|nr:ACT domain-containing protein [Phycisphaerae bacterium]